MTVFDKAAHHYNGFSQVELLNHFEVIGFKSVTSRTFDHRK